MTVIEESNEFIEKLTEGKGLPLFTSCCPAWLNLLKTNSDMVDNISTCKSPQQMFGSVLKEYYKGKDKEEGKETIVISIMPCTAKRPKLLEKI